MKNFSIHGVPPKWATTRHATHETAKKTAWWANSPQGFLPASTSSMDEAEKHRS